MKAKKLKNICLFTFLMCHWCYKTLKMSDVNILLKVEQNCCMAEFDILKTFF